MYRNIIGKNNPRWNGGVSEYPDHATMKRNRLIKLREAKNQCEVCGAEAYCVHHLDESKDNHSLDNLAVVCFKCHGILHAGRDQVRKANTKYSRLYGMTLKEMVAKYGGSIPTYTKLHKQNELKKFLDKARHRV